jgi:group II intron reverse transcriptase/maturase/CRISPR-associated endonuclease Cas1
LHSLSSSLPDLKSLFPIYRLRVTLTLKKASTFPFNHRYVLAGYIRHQLAKIDNKYAEFFHKYGKLDAVESGHLAYPANSDYVFDIILTNPQKSPQIFSQLLQQIHQRSTQNLILTNKANNSLSPDNIKLKYVQNIPLFNTAESKKIWQSTQPIILENYHYEQLKKHLYPVTYDEFCQQVKQQPWKPELTIEWLTPARLTKSTANKYKGEQRYMADKDNIDILRILFYIANNPYNQQNNSQTYNDLKDCLPIPSQIKHNVFWLNLKAKTKRIDQTYCGGLLGEIQLSFSQPLSTNWQQLLSYSQFIGIGSLNSFGWGRYTVTTNAHRHLYTPPIINTPNLWQQAFNRSHLEQILQQAKSELKVASRDKYKHINIDYLIEKIQKINKQLKQKKYKASSLKAWQKKKPKGGYRIITAPNFEDRVLQKATANILAQHLEKLFYNHSYGYRPKRSRQNAKETIKKAMLAGYKWVFESDIEQFFDNVNHHTLAIRLKGIFGKDPIIKLILSWMKAPYLYGQIKVQRNKGLPQGNPLSPILSNLILDDFDNDLQKQGHLLIRYADDFIILSKTKQQSEQAEKAVKQSLEEHYLKLNLEKTNHLSPQETYEFLGYSFPSSSSELNDNQAFNSKIACPLTKSYQIQDEPSTKITPIIIQSIENSYGNTIIIQGSYKEINTHQNQLKISENEKNIACYPWQQIQSIILIGKHQITTASLQNALEFEKNIYFLKSNGQFQGTLYSHHAYNKKLYLQQIFAFDNQQFALNTAQKVIQQKSIQQYKLLKKNQSKAIKPIQRYINAIQKYIEKIPNSQSIEKLMAIEGLIANNYYKAYQQFIPQEYQFTQRNKRPPKDPINILLSLGYTMLYNYTDSLITIQGLNPFCGYMHKARGNHKTLASDQMEPYRTKIDQTILKLINQKQIKYNDFYKTSNNVIQFNPDKRKIYLQAIMQTLSQQTQTQASSLQQIISSNKKLIKAIKSNDLANKKI